MIQQGGGGIINVGSMASLGPIPYASIYSSSKAYVLMFSEAAVSKQCDGTVVMRYFYITIIVYSIL